jgi:hypothetical protein
MFLGGNRPGVVMNAFKVSLCILICAFSCIAFGCGSEKAPPASQKKDKSVTSEKPRVVVIPPDKSSAVPSQPFTAPMPRAESSPPPPNMPTQPPPWAGPPPGIPAQLPPSAGPPPGIPAQLPPSAGPPPGFSASSPDATRMLPPQAPPPASTTTQPKAKAGQLDDRTR